MRRVLLPSNAVVGDSPRLTGALHHHLGHVLRLRPGARLLLVEESGVQHLARVVAITADDVELAVEERWPAGPVPRPRLTLVYGLSRRTRTEWVLQKATELGVDQLQLALCVRSVSQPEGDRKLERWREIIRQAARQCRRDRLPELAPAAPLAVALQRADAAEVKLLAHPDGEPLAALEERLAMTSGEVALAVGPEGGFCPAEVEEALGRGFSAVALGPTVLRTETAALTLLALVAYLTGRLDGSTPGDCHRELAFRSHPTIVVP